MPRPHEDRRPTRGEDSVDFRGHEQAGKIAPQRDDMHIPGGQGQAQPFESHPRTELDVGQPSLARAALHDGGLRPGSDESQHHVRVHPQQLRRIQDRIELMGQTEVPGVKHHEPIGPAPLFS